MLRRSNTVRFSILSGSDLNWKLNKSDILLYLSIFFLIDLLVMSDREHILN